MRQVAGPVFEGLPPGAVAVLGIPYDENSSFLRGAAVAPGRIREVLHWGASNLCAESGLDLAAEPRFRDVGDLSLGTGAAALRQIEEAASGVLEAGSHLLALGGDHAITSPLVRAYSAHYPDLSILHLDAHPDLYDEYQGSRQSHASPFARIMEERLVRRLVQVGIRTMNPHQRAQAHRFAVEVIPMSELGTKVDLGFEGPLYLSLDLDVLDPAFAPGLSHQEPGGMSSREVIRLIQSIEVPLVGADIVEYNPLRDVSGITAAVAAKLLKELAARMLETNRLDHP